LFNVTPAPQQKAHTRRTARRWRLPQPPAMMARCRLPATAGFHLEEQHRLLLTAEEERHVRNTVHAEEDAPGGRGDPATIRHADVGLHQVVHHYRHVGKMIVGNLPAEQFMKQNGQLHNVVVILLSHGSLA